MKKYTLILSILVFLLFGFNFNIANASTTPAPDCAINSTLKLGSKGEEVTCLQSRLGVSVDGNFGRKTKAAVMAWQKSVGLKADGFFGPLSRNVLFPVALVSGDFSPGCDATSQFSITTGKSCLAPKKGSAVEITSPSVLPTAVLNTSYTFNPEAAGGTKNFSSDNYSWSVSAGTLPPGLNLIEGIFINGTPSEIGTYHFSLSASNGAQSAVKEFILKVAPATVAPAGNPTGAN